MNNSKKQIVMKTRKILLTLALASATLLAGYAAIKVKRAWKDSCKNCNIANENRACGECGGFLDSSYAGQDDDYIYYRYTCKECPHSCLDRIKK